MSNKSNKKPENTIKSGEEEMLEWVNERFIKYFARVHCLALIAKGHTHGYDIMRHIEKNYGFKVSPGSYYPLLQWLEDNGYIKGFWEGPAEAGKPSRKRYEATEKGLRVLEAAGERIKQITEELKTTKTQQRS